MVTNTLIIYAVVAVLLVAWVLAIILSVRRVLRKERHAKRSEDSSQSNQKNETISPMETQNKETYQTPAITVVEVKIEGLVCLSPRDIYENDEYNPFGG